MRRHAALLLAAVALSAPGAAAAATPVADSFVEAAAPARNNGTLDRLRTDGSPIVRSYLRFDVSGWVAGSSSATLELTPTSSLTSGIQVAPVADSAWGESTIAFGNAPPPGAPIATTQRPVAGVPLSVDVSAAISGDGPVSLALTSNATAALGIASRESGTAAQRPQLTIATGGLDTAPPSPTLTTPADGATLADPTPTFGGTAGTAAGDDGTVTVQIWEGTDTSGPADLSLAAAALAGGSFSATPGSPLADGLYTVAVEQRDAAANVGRSAERTFTIDTGGPAPGPTSLSPVADAYTDAAQPATNFGSLARLRTDGSPVVRSYLRFDVPSWASGTSRARLRVMPLSNLNAGLQVTEVASNSWGETAIDAGNAPALGPVVATTDPPRTGVPLEVDVTDAIDAAGAVSLALVSPSSTATAIGSREAAASADRPLLVIDSGGPDTAPPTPALSAPADGAQLNDDTPAFTGTAGTAPGDDATVTVHVWPGTDTSGPAPLSLPAATLTGGAFSVSPSSPLEDGVYTFLVEQADAAGNVGRSGERTFTVDTGAPPPAPASLTPVADAYVDAAQPGTNFGTLSQLRTDASPVVRSYLRFDVQGWSPGSSRATLRLTPKSVNKTGVTAARVTDDGWSETAITASNAPAPGTALDTSAPAQTGVPITLDVTGAITGNGPVTLALTSSSSTATSLASREAAGGDRPRLIIEQLGPDTAAPAVTLDSPGDGSTTSDSTPAFAGTAGTASGDSASVAIDIWYGSTPSGSPDRSLSATRNAATGAFSVSPSIALADGVHTARAEQSDGAGNVGRSAATTFTVDSTAAGDPTIAAAGDIACPPNITSSGCRQMATSDLLLQLDPDAVLALGDTQYEFGEYGNYLSVFDPSWGRVKGRLYPAIGNHEYGNSVNGQQPAGCDVAISGDPRSYACGYFDYFNGKGNIDGRAGRRGEGYYAFDVGSWRIYVLNSNCMQTGAPSCAAGGGQEQWLRADLAANPRTCSAMVLHHPMFSSDVRQYDTATYRAGMRPLWNAFYEHGGDLALAGHSHFYERFLPMRPDGTADSDAIQSFIVGTGGRNAIQPDADGMEPNSLRSFATFGVAEFTLHSASYEWRYVPIPGQSFDDAGSRSCH
jgi:hypothetical protein